MSNLDMKSGTARVGLPDAADLFDRNCAVGPVWASYRGQSQAMACRIALVCLVLCLPVLRAARVGPDDGRLTRRHERPPKFPTTFEVQPCSVQKLVQCSSRSGC